MSEYDYHKTRGNKSSAAVKLKLCSIFYEN